MIKAVLTVLFTIAMVALIGILVGLLIKGVMKLEKVTLLIRVKKRLTLS